MPLTLCLQCPDLYIYNIIINEYILLFIYIFNSIDAYLWPLVSCCLYLPDDCRMKTAWNQWPQINIHAIKYIWKVICIYLSLYHIIALSQILSSLQMILHLVGHKPTKWDSDNHLLLYIYKIVFNPINLELGTIPNRTIWIFKYWILNSSNPGQEFNPIKIHRANFFLKKKTNNWSH